MTNGPKDARPQHEHDEQDEQSISRPPATPAPSPVDPLLHKAIAHHNAGQLPQADALYRQVLQLSPSHAVALHLLGVIALQSGQGAVALDLIDRAIQANPDYPEAYFSRGNALYLLQQYPAAVECFDKAIRLKPDNAEAYFNRGNTLYLLRRFQDALESFDNTILHNPDYAQAHYNRGNTLYLLGRFQSALQSYDKAIQLRPDYAEACNSRGGALHALTLFHAALECFDKAIRLKPDYTEALDNRANTLEALRQYREALGNYEKDLRLRPDEYSRMLPLLGSVDEEVERIAMIENMAERKAALDALPPGLHSHPAVCNLRYACFAKTEAGGKDLVFYCAWTDEIWNPHTAGTKGIGGSEEAVIWLSRLLHERGWNVTVYASCGAREQQFDGVSWKPYWMWDRRDKQNVTVLWRHPRLASHQINSDQVILDLHDTIAEYEFTPERLQNIHKIFVKSRFHRSLYPRIRNRKFVVIPNGIDAELFEGNAVRDPFLMINTSSADRSLEAFLDCFQEIKKQVPNAKAQWAYGWGVWDSIYSSDAQRLQWKTKMQQRMQQLGVEELGRLSHGEIARLYRQANIFAYPSEFTEIDCISLSKAMAAGAIPITTDFAAMGEKSRHGGVFIHSNKTMDAWRLPNQFHYEITDPEQKAQFVREAVKLLLDPPSEAARGPMREWARSTFDWNKIADSWNSVLTSRAVDSAGAEGSAPAPAPLDTAVQENPEDAVFAFNRGNEFYLARQYQAAVESYDKAILLNPEYAEAYHNRGTALHELQQFRAAVESYDKAILLKPDYTDAYYNRGSTLNALKQYQPALESFDKAILLKPDHVLSHNNRGVALLALQQYETALQSFDKAILLNPDFAEAHNNRGISLKALQQYEASLKSLDKAILLKPDFADAHSSRGNVLLALKQFRAALQSYDRASLLKPDHEYLPGMRLYMKRLLCDWKDSEKECRQLEAAIDRGLNAALPFAVLAVSGSPELQKQAAEIYVRDKAPSPSIATVISPRPRRDRIRIGYFSADYYNHPTTYLMAELFERHDRSRFEIIGFSFGPNTVDEMTRRISTAMAQFLDLRSMTDREAAELSRKLEVDIAVDLKGFTEDSRPGIFAQRAAPIQVSYLAYPGTMGAEYMDYLIADHTLIPQTSQCHYSEKIVYLPDSYQVNDSQRPISPMPCTRTDEGLPESAFVFCCFNNVYKISPEIFDIWMRILSRVEGSVLWLLGSNPWVIENLRNEAARRGIEPQRLVFAKSLPVDRHLARQRLADLVLDTLPYNAHTTASDALWVGLPVLTRIGETFASRVAASLLRAVGLPQLITSTESEYEELAVELARNPQRLQALRLHLQQIRPTAPLFDCASFTRHLESAYTAIVDRYLAGLPPDHIHIPRCR